MKQNFIRLAILSLLQIIFAFFIVITGSFHAATFTVNTVLDENDSKPNDGICETASGKGICSLRAALQESNALQGADIINIPAGSYNITQTTPSPSFKISDDLELIGAGSNNTIIDAMSKARGFFIEPKNVNNLMKIGISGLTIKNGFTVGSGAGIISNNLSELRLSDISLLQNKSDIRGAGIYINCILCTVIIDNALIESNGPTDINTVGNSGGGIYFTSQDADSNFTLMNSTIRGNAALSGGGLSFVNATITLLNSTVSNNRAIADTLDNSIADGGGISVFGLSTVLNIVNSTISGNRSDREAGGIKASSTGVLALYNATITNNTALTTGGGMQVITHAKGSIFRLVNSIIAGNTDGGFAPDCMIKNVMIDSMGYNLIGNNSECLGTMNSNDLLGTTANRMDAKLGELQDNGGGTATHALELSSPAIDAGNPAGCDDFNGETLKTDQRGISGAVANNRASDSGEGVIRCDIGAFEFNQSQVTADAGPNQQVLINSIVTLDGSGSQASSGITLYRWLEQPRTTVSLSDSLISNPSFTAPTEPMKFSFELTITDAIGQQHSSTVEISVLKTLAERSDNTSTSKKNNSGSGCSINHSTKFDPLLILLLMITILFIGYRASQV